MFTKTISVLSALCICAGLFAKDYNLLSPDGKISVTVSTAEEITWTMSVDGRQIITPSPISYKLADGSIYCKLKNLFYICYIDHLIISTNSN